MDDGTAAKLNLPESDPSKMNFANEKSKAWRDIWSAGQGIGAIAHVPTAAELVARLAREYDEALRALVADREVRA